MLGLRRHRSDRPVLSALRDRSGIFCPCGNFRIVQSILHRHATGFAVGESDCSAVRACRYVREKVGLDDGTAEQQDEEAEDDKQDYLAIKWDEEATLDLLNSMSLLGNLGEETVGICAQLSSDIGRLHEAVQKLGFDVDDADREVSKAQHDFPVVAAVATGDYHLKILLAQLDQLSASLAAESNVRSVG